MEWNAEATAALREVLANLYPTERQSRRVVADAGLKAQLIAFQPAAIDNWFSILEEAGRHAGRTDRVIEVARKDYPEEPSLLAAMQGALPAPVTGPPPGSWRGQPSDALEKITGAQSTLVPIGFLETALATSLAVARVRLEDGSAGTGFLVSANRLVTNNHVLPSQGVAAGAVAQFNFQQTPLGTTAAVHECRLLPSQVFRTSIENDWTIVAVDGDPNARWGKLELRPLRPVPGDRVNIVQHPGGGYKQISFYFNQVVFVGETRVQYLTDTLPGSSGSPVLDRDWNVIGIHHSGGWIPEEGKSSSQVRWRNEGILTAAILGDLLAG